MRRSPAAASLLALALARSSQTAAAEPATVHLEYRRESGAGSCVSPEQLARDVETRLGRPVFVEMGRAELAASVRARRLGRRFVIEIELFDRAGQSLGRRELSTRAGQCSALDDSLALVLALAADVPQEATPTASPPAAVEAPAAAPTALKRSIASPSSIPDSSADSTDAPQVGLELRPSLGGAAALGLVPSLALGLELGVELRFARAWPITLHVTGLGEQRQAATAPSRAATFTAQTLVLGVCPWTGALGGLEASLCVAQCLGRVQARGVGFDEAQHDDGWLFNTGAGVGLSRTFGPLFVTAAGTLLVPVVRRRYFFTDDVDITLYEQPWLGGLLALRVGTKI